MWYIIYTMTILLIILIVIIICILHIVSYFIDYWCLFHSWFMRISHNSAPGWPLQLGQFTRPGCELHQWIGPAACPAGQLRHAENGNGKGQFHPSVHGNHGNHGIIAGLFPTHILILKMVDDDCRTVPAESNVTRRGAICGHGSRIMRSTRQPKLPPTPVWFHRDQTITRNFAGFPAERPF